MNGSSSRKASESERQWLNLLEAHSAPPRTDTLSGLSGLFTAANARSATSKPPTSPFDLAALAAALSPPATPPGPPGLPLPLPPRGNALRAVVPIPPRVPAPPMRAAHTKRRVFFSFHFADVMRVNNVRKAFEFQPNPSFYDSSLWESRRLEGDEALKRLIRQGVENTSVVCVLVGTHTWSRRWVRYEIARSIADRKGLLAVDINGINHHQDRVPHPRGPNPLAQLAVGKVRDDTYRLFEWRNGGWYRYDDYSLAVTMPRYLREPAVGYVTRLEEGTSFYDFASQNGSKNIGGWIDLAAARADR